MIAQAAYAGDFCERRRKPNGTVEIRVLFQSIVISKWGKGEIEIEKDLMDSIFGVDKIEFF